MEKTYTPPAYSPGPWHIGHRSGITCNLKDANGSVIAAACGENFEQNARLIAAAPALVEALEELLDVCLDGRMEVLTDEEEEVVRQADEALNAAYGH
jgi:hypothetical protein